MNCRRPGVGLIALGAILGVGIPRVHGQNEIDKFMERVLERRQNNWVRLHDYVLDERERIELVGPEGCTLWSVDHEYAWYVRDGYLVRSPVRFDGVGVGEVERREFEQDWRQRERRRRSRRGPFENNTAGERDTLDEPRDSSRAR